MKKVLIITYYWPPSGGAGVQRWLKFVKYLREFGWEPIIYTPENPEAPAVDESLLRDIPENLTVLKTKIWEPYSLYKSFIGQKKGEKINAGFLSEKKKPGLSEKISVWIRGNWFIPDARKFWIQPSIKFLSEYLRNSPVDVMVSTGPPHSMHLIALGLKKKSNLPWLADFRDPWTNIDFYDKLGLTKYSDAKHRKLELDVLKNADKVSVVSWNWAKDFNALYQRNYEVITNGFDNSDFSCNNITPDSKFSISHIGSINKDRNPHVFWKALNELLSEIPSLKNNLAIKLIGKNDLSVTESIKQNNLFPFCSFISYLPHHEAIKKIQSSQLLLLPLNDTPNTLGIIPGKIFEYLAAKRPIIAIGEKNGDSAKILLETNSGVIFSFNDHDNIKIEIKKLFEKYLTGCLSSSTILEGQYSRKNLTRKLAETLDSIAKL